MESRLIPLMGIIGFAWLLILLGSYIIFNFILHINIFPEKDYVSIFFNSLLKVILSSILAFLWIVIMMGLVKIHMRRCK
ncbi:MAG: hypothetical protein QXP55_01845 [Nitrososphaerales archaeon]